MKFSGELVLHHRACRAFIRDVVNSSLVIQVQPAQSERQQKYEYNLAHVQVGHVRERANK